MGFHPIGTQGELAKILSLSLGKSIVQLDTLNSKKDGVIEACPPCIAVEFPTRVVSFSNETFGSEAGLTGEVIENGDGKIDGNDMLLIQVRNGNDIKFIGGRLSNLLDGYESVTYRGDGKYEFKWEKKELPELKKARGFLAEIQRRRITLFTDFTKHVDDIFKKVFAS